jgi:hypothetical protein
LHQLLKPVSLVLQRDLLGGQHLSVLILKAGVTGRERGIAKPNLHNVLLCIYSLNHMASYRAPLLQEVLVGDACARGESTLGH